MATLDPSLMQPTTQFDPGGAQMKAYQLKDLIQNEQVNELKLTEAKRDSKEEEQIRSATKGLDVTSKEGQQKFLSAVKNVSPAKAMDYQRKFNEYESSNLALEIQHLNVASMRLEPIREGAWSVVHATDEAAQQIEAQITARGGKADPTVVKRQAAMAAMPKLYETLNKIRDAKDPEGKPLLPPTVVEQAQAAMAKQRPEETVEMLRGLAIQSDKVRDQIKQSLEERKIKTGEKSEAERERHDWAMEAAAAKRGSDPSAPQGSRAEQLQAAMDKMGVTLPGGVRNAKVYKSRIESLANDPKNTDKSPEEIAQQLKTGQLEFLGGKEEEKVIARKEAAIAGAMQTLTKKGGLYDQLLETAKKVNFGDAKVLSRIRTAAQEGYTADPDIQEYVTTLVDARAELAIALSRTGTMTDQVRVASEHALPVTASFEELKRSVERSKKIAGAIKSGNTDVQTAIEHGISIESAEAIVDKKGDGKSYVHPSGAKVTILE